MEEISLIERIQDLTDLELALLLSLVAGEHCIIQTEEEALDSLEEELELIAANVFGLSHATIHCTSSTTLDELSNGILVNEDFRWGSESAKDGDEGDLNQQTSSHARPSVLSTANRQGDRGIASIVILKNLDLADEHVQIQVLELLRTKRIFTRTAFYSAPKTFLVVAVKSSSGLPLVNHLNDHIFISHYHGIDDGFANLEEGTGWFEDDRASTASVVHRFVISESVKSSEAPILSSKDIRALTALKDRVVVAAEVNSYLHSIISFLRLHRAVGGGITPRATRHLNLLVKCLAPLHKLDFVTPSLVTLAVRKIYPHRIEITSPENERSMQYGSDLSAVATMLDGMTAEQVVEEVLVAVEAPL
ncbi:hypothetical protein MMC31_000122 [Peltigera leucophlebia]|nr:hypothetical protein [Peltigera leucophlebia]